MKFKITCHCGRKLVREWNFVENTNFEIKCSWCGKGIKGVFIDGRNSHTEVQEG